LQLCRDRIRNHDVSVKSNEKFALSEKNQIVQRAAVRNDDHRSRANAKLTVRSQVVLKIRLRVSERNAVILEKSMNLKTRIKSEHALDLILRQRAGAVALDGNRHQRLSGKIQPPALERVRDVIRQIERDLHDYLPLRILRWFQGTPS
jgi:hypothetical protein